MTSESSGKFQRINLSRDRRYSTKDDNDESTDDPRAVSTNSIYQLFRNNSNRVKKMSVPNLEAFDEKEEIENDHLNIDLGDIRDSDLPGEN